MTTLVLVLVGLAAIGLAVEILFELRVTQRKIANLAGTTTPVPAGGVPETGGTWWSVTLQKGKKTETVRIQAESESEVVLELFARGVKDRILAMEREFSLPRAEQFNPKQTKMG